VDITNLIEGVKGILFRLHTVILQIEVTFKFQQGSSLAIQGFSLGLVKHGIG
jgi:hypothetical protein